MKEIWAHRADLAESAIHERHSSRVWGIPRTNLAVISWPPNLRDKLFVRWHYWWQAHYLDCCIDAALRRSTPARVRRVSDTLRGIRIRNLSPLTKNKYYDDKAWLALALRRVARVRRGRRRLRVEQLERNILGGRDGLTGALPWREKETYYNVPTNGPTAIMLARTGNPQIAAELTDWVFENLLSEKGLIMDGVRMRMHGPEVVSDIHPYCQGVMLGACLELAKGPGPAEITSQNEQRVVALVKAIAKHLATSDGVITAASKGGDGGMFAGILMRYLAQVALEMPGSTHAAQATRRRARQMVLATAEAVWARRLEVDGLPIFSADWGRDAQLPADSGPIAQKRGGAVFGSSVPERDLSVQLAGWMLMEAAALLAAADSR